MSAKILANLRFFLVIGLFNITTASIWGADNGIMEKVDAMIQKIEGQKSPERTDFALQLSDYIKQQNTANISKDVVARIASLLKDRDDSVRYWAAMALGYIGPKANSAVPQLLTALKEIEKEKEERKGNTGKSSADAIQLALQRIQHPTGNQ